MKASLSWIPLFLTQCNTWPSPPRPNISLAVGPRCQPTVQCLIWSTESSLIGQGLWGIGAMPAGISEVRTDLCGGCVWKCVCVCVFCFFSRLLVCYIISVFTDRNPNTVSCYYYWRIVPDFPFTVQCEIHDATAGKIDFSHLVQALHLHTKYTENMYFLNRKYYSSNKTLVVDLNNRNAPRRVGMCFFVGQQ